MARLQGIVQNGNILEVGGISSREGVALKELYTEQNAPFISYPDFSQILMDWDRNVGSGDAGSVDVYGITVHALSQTMTKTGTSGNPYLDCPGSGTKLYKIAGRFSFYGGEKIGESICCKFYGASTSGGSGSYLSFKVTPSIFLVHTDGTTSSTITYKQSGTLSPDANGARLDYIDTSNTYLEAQYLDKLVLQYDIEYVGGSGIPTGLRIYPGGAFSGRNPTQISVR